MDSDSRLPVVMCVISGVWLMLIIGVNDGNRENDRRRSDKDEDEIDESDIA